MVMQGNDMHDSNKDTLALCPNEGHGTEPSHAPTNPMQCCARNAQVIEREAAIEVNIQALARKPLAPTSGLAEARFAILCRRHRMVPTTK